MAIKIIEAASKKEAIENAEQEGYFVHSAQVLEKARWKEHQLYFGKYKLNVD